MVRDALVRRRVVVEEAVDVVQPAPVRGFPLQTSEAQHVALAEPARITGDPFRGLTVSGVDQLGQTFDEEAPVDQDGDAANPHRPLPGKRKAPGFRHTLGIGERAYSTGADVFQIWDIRLRLSTSPPAERDMTNRVLMRPPPRGTPPACARTRLPPAPRSPTRFRRHRRTRRRPTAQSA